METTKKIIEVKFYNSDCEIEIKKMLKILNIKINFDNVNMKYIKLDCSELKMIWLFLYCKINKIDCLNIFPISKKYHLDSFIEGYNDILLCKNY